MLIINITTLYLFVNAFCSLFKKTLFLPFLSSLASDPTVFVPDTSGGDTVSSDVGDDGYADTFEYKGCKYTRVDGDVFLVETAEGRYRIWNSSFEEGLGYRYNSYSVPFEKVKDDTFAALEEDRFVLLDRNGMEKSVLENAKRYELDGDIINVFYTTEELPATVTGEKAIQARVYDDFVLKTQYARNYIGQMYPLKYHIAENRNTGADRRTVFDSTGKEVAIFPNSEFEVPGTVMIRRIKFDMVSDDPYAVIVYDAYDNQRKTTIGELMKEYEGWEKKYN